MVCTSPERHSQSPAAEIGLVDAIHEIDISQSTQSVPPSVEERAFHGGLNLGKLAQGVPVQAVLIIRNITILTDETLQSKHYQKPTDDLALSIDNSNEVTVNCLC